MNVRGHFMSQKRTLKTWGRRGRGQIKNACAQDQKGKDGGLLNNLLQKAGSAAAGAPKTSE